MGAFTDSIFHFDLRAQLLEADFCSGDYASSFRDLYGYMYVCTCTGNKRNASRSKRRNLSLIRLLERKRWSRASSVLVT